MSDRFTRGGPLTGMARRLILPLWLAYPLALLGLFLPLPVIMDHDWSALTIGLVVAILVGAWSAWLFKSEIVASDEESVTVRTRRRR